MQFNHLEQIVAEWLEYKGYFVRRNIKVGKRARGGYECELDIVAYHPQEKKLVHFEPSTDTDSWSEREGLYKKKFDAGREYAPSLFKGIDLPEIEQFALFLYGSDKNHQQIGGGKVLLMPQFLKEIVNDLSPKKIVNEIVPEQFPLLRMIHLACEHRKIFSHTVALKPENRKPNRPRIALPLAIEAIYEGERIGIAKALEIRSQYKGKDFKTPFTCVSCGRSIRAHKDGGGAAHFEHMARNPQCPLSYKP